MFSGIVEEIGQVKSIIQAVNDQLSLEIYANQVLSDIKLGDSIAVNGVCLTVTNFNSKCFSLDIMHETVKRTNLQLLKTNTQVNLERALNVNSKLGGHFVTGHIDATGTITKITPVANAISYEINIPYNLMKYCINQGSIAVDGTSLTLFGVDQNASTIKISLIPHTQKYSILGSRKIGDLVNIECDMLGKYVINYLEQANSSNNLLSKINSAATLTQEFLQKNGF